MATLGKLNINRKELDVEWTIRNFSSLRKKADESYCSPMFHFANASWCLEVFPNGTTAYDSVGFVDIYLNRKSFGSPISVECSVGIKSSVEMKDVEEKCAYIFTKRERGYGVPFLLSRSELFERKSELMPFDELTFTMFCTVKDPDSTADASDLEAAEYSYSSENLDSKKASSNETCTNNPVRCSECSTVVRLQNSYKLEHQGTRTEDLLSLTQDYKKVLLEGKNHDLILKIGEKEFRAHQDILRARSRVFQSMLDHDMKEKSSGIIDVPDCDPEAMELFLSYVYCGKVEALDQSNMLGLYYVADKYDMQGLKDACCEFIKTSLSTTNICDVLQLSLNHSDTGLLEFATEYFINNALDILRTVEWQSFLKDNSTVGNELLIKSLEKSKT